MLITLRERPCGVHCYGFQGRRGIGRECSSPAGFSLPVFVIWQTGLSGWGVEQRIAHLLRQHPALGPPPAVLGARLLWEQFSRALSGSLDFMVLLKVMLRVAAPVPTTLMSRLFKKICCGEWLLALVLMFTPSRTWPVFIESL